MLKDCVSDEIHTGLVDMGFKRLRLIICDICTLMYVIHVQNRVYIYIYIFTNVDIYIYICTHNMYIYNIHIYIHYIHIYIYRIRT